MLGHERRDERIAGALSRLLVHRRPTFGSLFRAKRDTRWDTMRRVALRLVVADIPKLKVASSKRDALRAWVDVDAIDLACAHRAGSEPDGYPG